MSTPADWRPLSAWPDDDPAVPSRDALRQRLRRMTAAGQPVPWARRIGKLIYVSRAAWLAWIDAHELAPSRPPRAA